VREREREEGALCDERERRIDGVFCDLDVCPEGFQLKQQKTKSNKKLKTTCIILIINHKRMLFS